MLMFPVGASHPSSIPIVESLTPVVSSTMYMILTQLISYLIGNPQAVITCSESAVGKYALEQNLIMSSIGFPTFSYTMQEMDTRIRFSCQCSHQTLY